ncbi:MAG: hypothetical protein ACK4ND_06125 [Cytophagaceae bacterium]
MHIPEDSAQPLDRIIAGGKRFLAYDIINGLKSLNKNSLLTKLETGVSEQEKNKGKKHQAFRSSNDARSCKNKNQVEIYLDYMHHNPVSGKWNLVSDFTENAYSSAAFYE